MEENYIGDTSVCDDDFSPMSSKRKTAHLSSLFVGVMLIGAFIAMSIYGITTLQVRRTL